MHILEVMENPTPNYFTRTELVTMQDNDHQLMHSQAQTSMNQAEKHSDWVRSTLIGVATLLIGLVTPPLIEDPSFHAPPIVIIALCSLLISLICGISSALIYSHWLSNHAVSLGLAASVFNRGIPESDAIFQKQLDDKNKILELRGVKPGKNGSRYTGILFYLQVFWCLVGTMLIIGSVIL